MPSLAFGAHRDDRGSVRAGVRDRGERNRALARRDLLCDMSLLSRLGVVGFKRGFGITNIKRDPLAFPSGL